MGTVIVQGLSHSIHFKEIGKPDKEHIQICKIIGETSQSIMTESKEIWPKGQNIELQEIQESIKWYSQRETAFRAKWKESVELYALVLNRHIQKIRADIQQANAENEDRAKRQSQISQPPQGRMITTIHKDCFLETTKTVDQVKQAITQAIKNLRSEVILSINQVSDLVTIIAMAKSVLADIGVNQQSFEQSGHVSLLIASLKTNQEQK
jgi:hypothetical protein